MAWARGLGLLLVLLPVVGASKPGIVVRLNKEVLSYVAEVGKVPLQQALQVPIPHFLDRSGQVIQPTRIQILNVHMPYLQLKFIAGFGIRLSAATNFTFKIFRVPEPLHLMLPVTLLADTLVAQGSIGTPVVSISACYSLFNKAVVFDGYNSTAPALLAPLQKHIKAVLQNKLCLRISNLVQGLNVHLGTLIGLSPVGPESQVRYTMINAPNVTKDYISFDINAVLFLLGKPIILPMDATPFVLPSHVGTSGVMATVGLSQDLFDSAILLLQKAGALNMDITGQLKLSNNPLNTSTLGQVIPEVARQFPEPRPLALKVRLDAIPVVTLHTNNATLRIQPFVEVLAPDSDSAFQSLFSLDVVVNLSLQLYVSEVRLQGTTSVLGNVQVTVASSNVGFIEMEQVQSLMGNVFQRPLLDHLNALLSIGVALPSVTNLRYIAPEVFVYEGYIVVSGGLLYQR
ncbi:BPI fold-containing family B member 2 [Camelus dromedarius]|uniref:BPI fold-containing family B member 2 n=1 Tax=Camelus bactrianus TaxID=9837 RepID=A0AC58NZP2_CAMBA|nr:BPI fold-containing family B member 2 [Camelus dromedarius]